MTVQTLRAPAYKAGYQAFTITHAEKRTWHSIWSDGHKCRQPLLECIICGEGPDCILQAALICCMCVQTARVQ